MITTDMPETWRDLQRDAAQILEECGFDVEIEKNVTTVRGEVEIDVYAEERVRGRRYQILCECKHWRTRVPQTTIHAFRTVVADFGANVGYMISLNGFQSGALAASELTNIKLVTWHEFQAEFEETWLEHYFAPQLTEQLDPLLTYTEPLAPRWFWQLPEEEKAAYVALHKKYAPFGHLIMTITPYIRIFRHDRVPELPLIEHIDPDSGLLENVPRDILTATGYRHLFDGALTHGNAAIAEFRAIRDRNGLGPEP